jgi:bifunctional DNA-binding transcriptional regulator/antitoxin component of YhaV-PrlF toxin-antitoxin module
MTVTVKASASALVVPPSVRRRAGIKAGDQLEFQVSGGIINIIPKLPSADDEYTHPSSRAKKYDEAKIAGRCASTRMGASTSKSLTIRITSTI